MIQNVTDYRDKIKVILNKDDKFERLDKNQTVTRENRENIDFINTFFLNL